MVQAKLSSTRLATQAFEAVVPPPDAPEAVQLRLAKLERAAERAEEFLGVIAERISALESENALLRDELLIMRATRVRSPSSPYNIVTPTEETVRIPAQSGARRLPR